LSAVRRGARGGHSPPPRAFFPLTGKSDADSFDDSRYG
jgi:hypothetical protein